MQAGGIIITSWIIAFIEQFGYISIFLLIALENVFPPIPSEIILAFGGFMTTHTELTVLGVVSVATAGSVFGAAILYFIGYKINAKKLDAVIGRYGGALGLKSNNLHQAFALFRRYKNWAVFLCRMIPIIRSLISIPAGMAGMKFKLFIFLTAAGTFLWNLLLVSIGAMLGESWEEALSFVRLYQEITYLIIVLAGAAYFVYRSIKKKRQGNK